MSNRLYGTMLTTLSGSDLYQYTMSNAALYSKLRDQTVVFNMFFRKAPHGNGWAVVSGITEVVQLLRDMGTYPVEHYKKFLPDPEFNTLCKYLASTKFEGEVWAMREGEIAFPNENIITIKAPFIQAQILETPLLSIMNHQMNVATKASRVCRSTKKSVAEFGSRRANGIWAAEYGGKAAYIGGCTSTSNTLAAAELGIPCTGTHAHSWIEAHFDPNDVVGSEYKAFVNYIEAYKPTQKPLILLADTYDPINCGIPNAIKAFKDMGIDDRYEGIYGIRLDSGDLVYQSQYARKMLDEAGFERALVFATDGLDEYLIPQIEAQGACIDCYGVGDAIACCKGDPCFGGVYKLAEVDGQPCIKVSANPIKIINPGHTITLRVFDKESDAPIADVIVLAENDPTYDELTSGKEVKITSETECYKSMVLKEGSYYVKTLQSLIYSADYTSAELPSPKSARAYHASVLASFDSCYTRLLNPHRYIVDLSNALYDLKYGMIKNIKTQISEK